VCVYSISGMLKIKIKIKSGLVRVVNDETGVTSRCTRGLSLLLAHVAHAPEPRDDQRNEKISNKSSFGIIDIAFESSTTDRIIVIVKMACFIHDGAYR